VWCLGALLGHTGTEGTKETLWCYTGFQALALFSSEKNSDFAIVALSFLFDKYCLIMKESKYSSRDLQTNC